MLPDKLTVTDLKEGKWIVNWQLYYLPKEELHPKGLRYLLKARRFRCADHEYDILFSYDLYDVTLALKTTCSESRDECQPKNVAAILDGEMKVLTRVTSKKYQFAANWSNKIIDKQLSLEELYKKNFQHQLPSIQLIIDFQVAPTSCEDLNEKRLAPNPLAKLFETRFMSDVVFSTKNQDIKAHSAIVATGSPVFAAMFQEGAFKESQTRTVIIEDIGADVLNELLRFLYTGAVHFNETTESLFQAADKYQIDLLKVHCADHLKSTLNVENVVRRLILAHLYSSSDLLEEAIHYIAGHKEDVWFRPDWKEFSKNYPDLFFSVTLRLVVG